MHNFITMYDTKSFKIVKFIITVVLFLLTLMFGTITKCAAFFIVVQLNPTVTNINGDAEHGVADDSSRNSFDQNNLIAWVW